MSLSGSPGPGRGYALRSELVRLSLPAAQRDANRVLAWANSICFLFLLVGILGSVRPTLRPRVLPLAEAPVPVVFTAPDEPPPPAPEPEAVPRPEEPEPVEAPPVVAAAAVVAAVANPLSVEFPVPVKAAVAVAIPALAAPPPPVPSAPAGPVQPPGPPAPAAPMSFNPATAGAGSFPLPNYPLAARRARSQGTVTVGLLVDALGNVTSVRVAATSGYPLLDEAALQVVRNRWRFPAGTPRNLIWDCTFQLE